MNNINGDFFVTGATGFLGTEIISQILEKTDVNIYVLVRCSSQTDGENRLRSAWWEYPELRASIGHRVFVVKGDIEKDDLGMDESDYVLMNEHVKYIIHAAAEVGIQNSGETFQQVNVTGTRNVIAFGQMLNEKGDLNRFTHISTAYVAGQHAGIIMEDDFETERFSSLYEMSKAAGEKLVMKSDLPYTICRPSMIVGNSKTGRIRNFNTIYYVLKLIMNEKLRVLPVSRKQKINIVPVDYVAGTVIKATLDECCSGKCLHLTSPQDSAPCAGELTDYVASWAAKNLNIRIRIPMFVPLPYLKVKGIEHNNKKVKEKSLKSNLLALMPYFYDDHIFDRTMADTFTGKYEYNWRDYIDVMLDYACRNNFMHQTERNVFEQILFRQQSEKAPVTYYDVTSSEIKETSGLEMYYITLEIASALKAIGIKKGDRVALTGINCTDYFALDVAIGLIGAVSVPIYYTTPVHEVDMLLEKSGAKILFVGDRRIMAQLESLKSNIDVVAFSDALEVEGQLRHHMKWNDFLAKANPQNFKDKIYAGPDDLATIRYTSGTTGEPKGVMFNAGQLKWMGQVLTSLLPWKEKQTEMRYLSFLPLSHVVEGILASYAPYFMLCPVKYYYLNDFDSLTSALPKVRPTVFFSVPRFYEKLWQQIEENKLGKKYLKMSAGFLKKIMGRIIKKAVLRKAGLDQCSQLIVGSAPMSEDLMKRFRELGIEIHNAYGQTEAPLITINRMGDNVIPSIGTPLPDTEVTVKEDGELVVKGPQVCLGYYGLNTEAVSDGILLTGDLGSIDGCGHVYLEGRKKEMIITSYGKNINCPKIESRIKDISGVAEAVLIGENRPYCSALIWLENEVTDLASAIEHMNEKLSHPEQIRKWTVISQPLSIQKGELTPNLKVKRKVVEQHYSKEIESMYEKE